MWWVSLWVECAEARESRRVPLTIEVRDAVAGVPVPTATVRYPPEGDEHAVNTVTGAFTTDTFYLADNVEQGVVPGIELVLHVGAPGYLTERVTIEVRKRKNRYVVPLVRDR